MKRPYEDLISVILPVYNVEPYLVRCLDSIIANTYKKLEIIIVDDASTDGVSQIYDKYAASDARIKIVKHEKNMGVSAARNSGLVHSSGEYVHFFDPDDWICSRFYTELHKSLVETNASFAVSEFIKIYPNRKKYSKHKTAQILVDTKDKIDILKLPMTCMCWRNLFRKDFLFNNNILFPENMKMREDVIFMLNAVRHSDNVVTVPDACYYYFKRPGSAVNSNIDEIAKDNIKYAKKFSRDFLKEYNYNYYLCVARMFLSRLNRTQY